MSKFFLSILLVITILSSGCANIQSLSRVEASAIADESTTILALSRGGHELNPLGFWASTGVKGYYLFVVRPGLNDIQREQVDRVTSSLWSGAAVNNLVQLIWAPAFLVSAGVGIGFGYWLYHSQ
jgi:hypothetical protein